ncbi:hypothetical protein [Mesorhizobium sp.]|uniref:hypothetical protein n=1 Tax=Mesorhizobium sp. TaxID=1871066 RepID=UPI000FE4D5D5|nr:hypothetical protein [Mesorhizobium sp.]RWN11744.1 MAG: hypothetical protein EOR87_14585 [Mesorhizobium sp.]RWN19469.1 MAG: hypothetical protein EOR88_09980 [Mesorhizobium sp.]
MSSLKLAIVAVLAIVILGLAAGLFYYRGNAISAEAEAARARADRDTAIAVNKANEETIGRLKAAKEKSDQLAAALAEQIKTSNQSLVDAAAERRKLENENNDIRKFLALRIPDALRLRNDQAVGHR